VVFSLQEPLVGRKRLRHDQDTHQRQPIATLMVDANPRFKLAEFPGLFHRLCLDQLDRRESCVDSL
jgi:hypothetical protein